MAQFPSTLHPDIDAEVVKAYVTEFAVRQITAFDPDWKNSCLLCAELPTIENGLETQGAGVTGADDPAIRHLKHMPVFSSQADAA